MNDTQKNLLYLLSCAVNGITPNTARVQAMDWERLYRLAKFHTVRGAVCIALKRAEVEDKAFYQAYKKAVRKNIYLDMERSAILSDFENKCIWYMPLKGSVLKELYPENGMREMADNDVLFDADKQEQSKEIMLSHGYTAEHYGFGKHCKCGMSWLKGDGYFQRTPNMIFCLKRVKVGKKTKQVPVIRYKNDANN